MSNNDLYQLTLHWPSSKPSSVIVTGTFDKWAKSLHLTRTSTGFETTIGVPWDSTVRYKFIVDGEWLCRWDQATRTDPGGFVNNVFRTPPRPVSVPRTNPHSTTPATNGHAASSSSDAPSTSKTDGSPRVPLVPRLMSDALDYVASGFGAAVRSVVGVDPINSQKFAIPTLTVDDRFELPEPLSVDSNETDNTTTMSPASDPSSSQFPPPSTSSFVPIVPIMITPVNSAENNATSVVGVSLAVKNKPLIIEATTSAEAPRVVATEEEKAVKEISNPAPATPAPASEKPITTPDSTVASDDDGGGHVKSDSIPMTVTTTASAPASVETETESKPKLMEAAHPTPAQLKPKTVPTTPGSPNSAVSSALNKKTSPSKLDSGKKRPSSFFGKIKDIFHHDKEKMNGSESKQ